MLLLTLKTVIGAQCWLQETEGCFCKVGAEFLSACYGMARIAACLKLAEIFQSASKLRNIHLMLSNLSLECSSPPECDHGICNVNTLEVQVM